MASGEPPTRPAPTARLRTQPTSRALAPRFCWGSAASTSAVFALVVALYVRRLRCLAEPRPHPLDGALLVWLGDSPRKTCLRPSNRRLWAW